MALNKYLGYGISTALLWLMIILWRGIVKLPMVNYFGDFRADVYTETYAAHSDRQSVPQGRHAGNAQRHSDFPVLNPH